MTVDDTRIRWSRHSEVGVTYLKFLEPQLVLEGPCRGRMKEVVPKDWYGRKYTDRGDGIKGE